MLNNCQCRRILTTGILDITFYIKNTNKSGGNQIFILHTMYYNKIFNLGIKNSWDESATRDIKEDIYCAKCGKLFLTVDQFNDLYELCHFSFKAAIEYLIKLLDRDEIR